MGTYLIINALSLTLLNFYFRHRISVSTKVFVFVTFMTLTSTFETEIISIIIMFKVGREYNEIVSQTRARNYS